MHILRSSVIPKESGFSEMSSAFVEELMEADSVVIATGYTSAEALAFIGAVVEQNQFLQQKHSKVEVMLGMAAHQGLHPTIYRAAVHLDTVLRDFQVGSVRPVVGWPFHGKIYLFSKDGFPFSAIVGSSNSSALTPSHRLGEIDLITRDQATLNELARFLSGTLSGVLGNLADINPATAPGAREPAFHPGRFDFYADIVGESLDILKGVKRVPNERLLIVKDKLDPRFAFIHKLKVGPNHRRSNINAALGKGRLRRRKDGSTFVVPRPWYEVELILSQSERESPNAPPSRFSVITDDGWSFEMKRQGDYLKNLRSLVDLRPLGLWLKGRLENSDVLVPGDVVTEETLKNYGNEHLRLTPLDSSRTLWYLDFS
jgi:hypothetical protein